MRSRACCAVPHRSAARVLLSLLATLPMLGCAYSPLPPAPTDVEGELPVASTYEVGPLDTLNVSVFGAPELSSSVLVRPDGMISLPLVNEMRAAGKTTTQLAEDLQTVFADYVQDPVVTVTVGSISVPSDQQIRVIGAVPSPAAVPYRPRMTVLDVIIEVGGLTEYAQGNRAVLVRRTDGEHQGFNVRLDDLVRQGEIGANVPVLPGDVIIVPESYF
jgi:polysaccharide biosynthesis/export protein